jgi:hypothetical protein
MIPYSGAFTVGTAFFTSQYLQIVAEVLDVNNTNNAYGMGVSRVDGQGTMDLTVTLYSNLVPDSQYNLLVKLMDQVRK